jgi:hypothetical protein
VVIEVTELTKLAIAMNSGIKIEFKDFEFAIQAMVGHLKIIFVLDLLAPYTLLDQTH